MYAGHCVLMFISVIDWLNEYCVQEPLLMQHKKLCIRHCKLGRWKRNFLKLGFFFFFISDSLNTLYVTFN